MPFVNGKFVIPNAQTQEDDRKKNFYRDIQRYEEKLNKQKKAEARSRQRTLNDPSIKEKMYRDNGSDSFIDKLQEGLMRASNSFNKTFLGIDPVSDRVRMDEALGTNIASDTDKKIFYKPKTTGDKIIEGVSSAAGLIAPYNKAYQVADKALDIAKLTNLTQKLGKGSKYADDALRGALAGLQIGTATETRDAVLGKDNEVLKDRLKDIGLETLAGAVGDPLLRGLGNIVSPKVKALVDRFKKGEINEQELKQEILLLNEPQKQLNTFIEKIKPKPATRDTYKEVAATSSIPKENESFVVDNLKDISGFKVYGQDLYRNFKDVFGNQFDKVKPILDNFDDAKRSYIEMQADYLNRLKKDIVDGLGIKKGSKESALVQKYGEKKITLEELKRQAPNKWQDIVKADEWFRNEYDKLIDQVNETRMRIYPNDPEKIVPKRKDYYRHFRELDGLEGIKNLFDTPSGIDPSLVGKSEFTKPNSRFAGFMQRRGIGPYKNDAVGGFLNYIPAASYATKIDPQIKGFNQFKEQIRNLSKESKKDLSGFINFLDKFSQDLAGKTNPADRFFQEFLDKAIPGMEGRTLFKSINWMNKRVKSNVILGNIGSALSQFANIPTGVAFAKQYSIKGAGRTLQSILKENPAMKESTFLKERFSRDLYRQFDTRWIDQPRKLAEWMLETSDKIGTTFIWNSAYEKALAEGIKEPIRYADNMTRNLVAGRGIGEVPLLQKSKIFQIIAPFQLEVANLWKVQKDFVKAKDFGALATLFLANTMFNKAMEEIRGSGVVFDPIKAIAEASEEDLTPLQRGGRIVGEVLSNVPLGQTLASQYPEYGFNFYGTKMPTRKELFGDNDPTRYGTGLLGVLTQGLQDPLTKLALPFGGLQLEKTIKGTKGVINQGIYNDKNLFTNNTSQLKYPVSTDPINTLKGVLFGTGGFKETKEYYDNNRRPLSVKQTEEYKNAYNKKAFYEDLQKNRRINTLESRIKDVRNDKNLKEKERQQKLDSLLKQLRELKERK